MRFEFVLALAIIGALIALITSDVARSDAGDPPFEIYALATPDGSHRCVVVRETAKVMGGSTVALAIACFPGSSAPSDGLVVLR